MQICCLALFQCFFLSFFLTLNAGQAVGNLSDRHRVHQHTVEVCKDVLKRKSNVVWDSLMRDELRGCPIRDVDLVVTIGGDGTLLQASHCLDSSIPVVGVNSDPTRASEACFSLPD